MGQTAEVVAKDFGISRKEQDEFALESHRRAAAARSRLAEEIVPVPIGPAYRKTVDQDNGVRDNQTLEALTKLKPFFDRKFGTVTAGNSSQITDGACALLMMTEERAKAMGSRRIWYCKTWPPIDRMLVTPFTV